MKMGMPLRHHIKESTIEQLKEYLKPEEFMEYCKACQYYGLIWACPPYAYDVTKLLEKHSYAYIMGSKLYIKDLGAGFQELLCSKDLNYVSNEIYSAIRAELDQQLRAIESLGQNLFVLYAGRCLVCQPCTREKGILCVYPEKQHLSLESMGFDVSSICQDILKDEILWGKEQLPEYFLLVSAVLSPDKLEPADIYNAMGSLD